MASKTDSHGRMVHPHLEQLEDRLLLTTLHGGDTFVYRNAEQQMVRLDFNSTPEDTLELFAYDSRMAATADPTADLYGTNLVDLVGLHFAGGAGMQEVVWPNGQPVIEYNDDGEPSWVDYNHDEGVRGAVTEIYAIYINEVAPGATLAASVLSADQPNGDDWLTGLQTWDSTTPLITVIDETEYHAPEGSGGVVVGAYWSGIEDDWVRHMTVSDSFLLSVPNVPIHGVFPGGTVEAGIHVSDQLFSFVSGGGGSAAGDEVHSVATDSDGNTIAVDSTPFVGRVIADGTTLGLGSQIDATTFYDGSLYAANNSLAPVVADNVAGNGDVQSLAITDTDVFYIFDEGTLDDEGNGEEPGLFSVDPDSGQATRIGPIVDAQQGQYHFVNIRGMDYANNTLYAVGTMEDADPDTAPDVENPAGPFLLKIDDIGGNEALVNERFLIQDADGNATDVRCIAYDETELTRDRLYAITTENELIQINIDSGEFTLIADGAVEITGLDFIGGSLYGVSAGTLYNINTTTGAMTEFRGDGDLGITGMTSLAYSDSYPGYLFAMVDQFGHRLARVPLGTDLRRWTQDPAGGDPAIASMGVMVNDGDDTVVYVNVQAMDNYDGDGNGDDEFYAIATPYDLDPYTGAIPAERWLVEYDPVAGTVTELGQVPGDLELTAIAFTSAGQLYGVVAATGAMTHDEFYQLNPADGTILAGPFDIVDGGGAAVTGFEGMDFVQLPGGNEVLYGVTAGDATLGITGELYVIDHTHAGGVAEVRLLGDTGRPDLTSLAGSDSNPRQLWSASMDSVGVGYRGTSVPLAASFVAYDGAGQQTIDRLGVLYDDVEPAYVYTRVTGLDYFTAGANDVLYGAGEMISIDPFNVPDPAPAGAYVFRVVDEDTGQVSTEGYTDGMVELAAIAWNENDLYAVSGTQLYLLDLASIGGDSKIPSALQSTISVAGVVGLDFIDGQAYAVDADTLYTLDVASGTATEVVGIGRTGMSGLADDETDPTRLWGTLALDGQYYIVRLFADADGAKRDIDKIAIGGTVAGEFYVPGNINMPKMGFLFGNLEVGENLGYAVMMQGGGAVLIPGDDGDSLYMPDQGSMITAEGSITQVDSRGNTLYSGVEARSNVEITELSTDLEEMELLVDADNYSYYWMQGEPVDWLNDTMDTAQFVGHPSGRDSVTISGAAGDNVDAPSDYLAINLMAGQTIRFEDTLPMPWVDIWLMDYEGIVLDTWGFETEQDHGFSSRVIEEEATLQEVVFTAPAAGTYYLHVVGYYPGAPYQIEIENLGNEAIAGVSLSGDYQGLFTGTTGYNIATLNGSDLGGIAVTGEFDGSALASGGGVFRSARAGSMIRIELHSNSNIGLIETTTGSMAYGSIIAGLDATHNTNATIQNIRVETNTWAALDDFIWPGLDIESTGSIGVIEVGGDFVAGGTYGTIVLNSDRTNIGGRCELIKVGGSFGNVVDGINLTGPALHRNPGGDFRYIWIGGGVLGDWGDWTGTINQLQYQGTETIYLNDDSGGRIAITPRPTGVVDEEGNPVVDPDTGQQETFIPTVRWVYIAVDDSENPGDPGNPVGAGSAGVVANLQIDGLADIHSTGEVQISDLDLSGFAAANPNAIMTIGGSGKVDVYHIHSDAAIGGFRNQTAGELISGQLPGAGSIRTGGSIGSEPRPSGVWLPSVVDAPLIGGDLTPVRGEALDSGDMASEPQYGWFRSGINGLNIEGDVDSIITGGALCDIRATGQIGTIRVNSDGRTDGDRWDDWDGVRGIIWSQTGIGTVYVGDGLADDGAGVRARAAILSTGSIGGVYIDGPYYEVQPPIQLGPDETLKEPLSFGLLNGAIIAMTDTVTIVTDPETGEPVTDADGNAVETRAPAIGRVRATGGATITSLIAGADLYDWACFLASASFTGSVGTVEVIGTGGVSTFAREIAAIDGAEIWGSWIGTVRASENSGGITHSLIAGNITNANRVTQEELNKPIVSLIEAGGPGMFKTHVSVNGGDIGTVRGIGATGDIHKCMLVGTNGLRVLSARDVHETGLHMPGTVGTITVSRDMYHNTVGNEIPAPSNTEDYMRSTWVGAIGAIHVGRDFYLNRLNVATVIGEVTVGNEFRDSVLNLYGPTVSNLGSLVVTNDITGNNAITSAGKIGKIVSRNGKVEASIITLDNDWNSDLNLLKAPGGYFVPSYSGAKFSIAGTVHKFITGGDLGVSPASGQTPDTLDIWGDLVHLQVGTGKATGHLYDTVNVGGDIHRVDINGTLYGNLATNGSMEMFILDGTLGGQLVINGTPTDFGSLTVFGDLGTMKFPKTADIRADLTVGGDLGMLRLQGGSIYGNLTSRFGSLEGVILDGGSILGDVTANEIGMLYLRGGNIGASSTITVTGPVARITVLRGNVLGDITVEGGKVDMLHVSGSVRAGSTIQSEGGFGRVIIQRGDLAGDLLSEGDIDVLSVAGSVTGTVSSDLDIGRMVTGPLSGATVRAGGKIDLLVARGNVTNSTVSAGWHLTRSAITGSLRDSTVLAGYDVGLDGVVGTADDNALVGGAAHSGSIRSMSIGGVMDSSVLAAGVSPGADDDFTSLVDNQSADGVSRIDRLVVGRGFVNPSQSAVLADTYIDQRFYARGGQAGVVMPANFIDEVLPGTGDAADDFGGGTSTGATLISGGIILRLSGPGTANFNSATNEIVLNRTTRASSLSITSSSAATFQVSGADDASLASLVLSGSARIGDIDLDGEVRVLRTGRVASGSSWQIGGGVANALVASRLTNTDITVGDVGNWTIKGRYESGTMEADGISGRLYVGGDIESGAQVGTALGEMNVLMVMGDLAGVADVEHGMKVVHVTGDLSGDLTVHQGDLRVMKVASLSGQVNVESGGMVVAHVMKGNLGGESDTSLRTATGIHVLSVDGSLTGLVSTDGDITVASVGGRMTGELRSGRSITRLTTGKMLNAVVTAGGDLTITRVLGDMAGSWLLAGFDPGDAGYDNVNGEAGNVQIDRWSTPNDSAQQDQAEGGRIKLVIVAGDMGRHWDGSQYRWLGSSIGAGIDPGADGYLGSNDDRIRGTGYIDRVIVTGGIYGLAETGEAAESYGVYAANNMPSVFTHGNPFVQSSRAKVDSMSTVAGTLNVESIRMSNNAVSVEFSHNVDFSSVVNAYNNGGDGTDTTFAIWHAGPDGIFDGELDGGGNPQVSADDVNLADTVANTLTYTTPADDPTGADRSYRITLTLDDGIWENIGGNPLSRYRVVLDGTVDAGAGDDDAIRDTRGNVLDGEYDEADGFPTGNGAHGGTTVWDTVFGRVSMESLVPAYEWWFGCAPTAGTMVAGYWDSNGYPDLIPGDAAFQTDEVNESIASSGDGQYVDGTTAVVPGTPGTGHIPDYALFDGVDDMTWPVPYADLSEETIQQREGITPHDDNSMADFMKTSWSSEGLTFGGSFPDNMEVGMELYFSYRGYAADAELQPWGVFTWETLTSEIDAGRPFLLGVDSSGNGIADHAVTCIGYDTSTMQFAIYDTWDQNVHWHEFKATTPGDAWGISDAILIDPV